MLVIQHDLIEIYQETKQHYVLKTIQNLFSNKTDFKKETTQN